jgi:hypothetical protein
MLALDLGGLIRASTLAVIGVLGSFGAEPCRRRIGGRVRLGRHQAQRGPIRVIAPASAITSRAGVGALGEKLALLRRQRAVLVRSCQVRMVAPAYQGPLRFSPAGR